MYNNILIKYKHIKIDICKQIINTSEEQRYTNCISMKFNLIQACKLKKIF